MPTLTELAAQIVSSHASTSPMSTEELIQELQRVHSSLQLLETGSSIPTSESPATGGPGLTIKTAFKKNEVLCMICGKGGMKTLTRHLTNFHDITPRDYRKEFGIPATQPLTAKSYSDSRKQMALDAGLADNLKKAREVRMAKIKAKKATPAKPAKKVKTKTTKQPKK